MDALVFYCSNCKQTFLGRDYKEADRPPCPNCKRRTQSTGITKNVWVEMSKEERQEKLDALTQQEEKEKTRKAYAQSVGVTYEENVNHNEETAVDGWYMDIGKKIKGWAQIITRGGIIKIYSNKEALLMKKKTASIIGIILGIAIIIVGFCVMNPETYLLGTRDSLGSLIEFGADFYTEIYHMTYSTAHQVQKAYVNICNAIGWLIVAIGLFDIAYFVCKMASCDENYSGNNYNAAPTTASTYTTQSQATPTLSASTHTTQDKKTPNPALAKTERPPVVAARQDSMESNATQKKVYAEDEFVPGRSYSYGDEVIFENKRYVCVSPSATVWNPSQFPAQWKEISAEKTES